MLFSDFIAADVPEEEPVSTEDVQEGPEESAPVSGRGVPRKHARRARGRRGGAAGRARVVSTRIVGGRRQAIVPPATVQEDNNATLDETVSTETEESPKKTITTPEVKEEKASVTPKQESSQTDSASNVRASGRKRIWA